MELVAKWSMNQTRLSVRVNPETARRLALLAAHYGLSVSDFVRNILQTEITKKVAELDVTHDNAAHQNSPQLQREIEAAQNEPLRQRAKAAEVMRDEALVLRVLAEK